MKNRFDVSMVPAVAEETHCSILYQLQFPEHWRCHAPVYCIATEQLRSDKGMNNWGQVSIHQEGTESLSQPEMVESVTLRCCFSEKLAWKLLSYGLNSLLADNHRALHHGLKLFTIFSSKTPEWKPWSSASLLWQVGTPYNFLINWKKQPVLMDDS